VYGEGSIPTPRKRQVRFLVGPTLVHAQFIEASATAGLAVFADGGQAQAGTGFGFEVSGVDADWGDESGQVEVRLDVKTWPSNANLSVSSVSYDVRILAAM
jgi:hypothetical protein